MENGRSILAALHIGPKIFSLHELAQYTIDGRWIYYIGGLFQTTIQSGPGLSMAVADGGAGVKSESDPKSGVVSAITKAIASFGLYSSGAMGTATTIGKN